jgi:hypothetical protein
VDLETRVRRDHPLRAIREIANAALADLSEDFAALYPQRLGRPSVPPERLSRAMLLQAFYGIRSERQLMERMEFDLLFRWFVGLGVDHAAWEHSSFTTNRDRLLAGAQRRARLPQGKGASHMHLWAAPTFETELREQTCAPSHSSANSPLIPPSIYDTTVCLHPDFRAAGRCGVPLDSLVSYKPLKSAMAKAMVTALALPSLAG